jgi:hypothetical protein
VAQKLLEPSGALEGVWPLGRGQNFVNPCKRKTLEALEWPEVIRMERGAGGSMATGKRAV